jgi:glycosyltransferase involved in cell wall biosynthesis
VRRHKAEEQCIYVLHEYGNPTHYDGLKYYCENQCIGLEFFEFSFGKQFLKGIRELDTNKVKKSITNFIFLFQLVFGKGKNIVLGIAPFDYRMIFFNWLSRKHHFFYHTSWPYWDWKIFPKRKLHHILKDKIEASWRIFLEERCKGIFCVTEHGKEQIQANFKIGCPIETVYHSVDQNIFYFDPQHSFNKPLRFLFVGRLLEKKGIDEILKTLNKLPQGEAYLGIVGEGPLKARILAEAKQHTNIKYYGKVDRNKLGYLYRSYDVLLCPSKKGYSNSWEELFGMTIIEAMACGVIPIATNHIGPSEIIYDGVNGFLLEDQFMFNQLEEKIKELIHLDKSRIEELKQNAVQKGTSFQLENISRRWSIILKHLN